jgi:Ca2+-binding EF-hand superfamily protein
LVDKNEKLVLGMIWTIILRFTIAEISEEGLNAKEGLLLWCQRKTAGYKNVNVKDFTFSWQDGLAFCALIHRHRPDLLDFNKLNKANKKENVALAFDIAEKHLQIPKLLDVEDMTDITKPDERSVMTYVAQYFHAFAKLSSVEVAGRRIGKFAGYSKNVWDMQSDYEQRHQNLRDSIDRLSNEWSNGTFDGSYADAKKQSQNFINYKNTEKRAWVTEKRELESLLSNIITKRKTYNLSQYTPPEGFTLHDLDNAWSRLLAAESARRKVINEKIQQIKEELRVNYSKLANDFENDLNTLSQSLGTLDGDLPVQLEAVKELLAKLNGLEAGLEVVRNANNECESAGILESEREYTVFSVQDLEFDFGVVKEALRKKTAFIENQIVARKQTNLTPQQLETFESTFKQFDKNNSNTLNRIELKACLQSLDQAYESDEELDQIFTKWSDGKDDITFEQFISFMVSLTEDRTTPEQLLESFQKISHGKDHITITDLLAAQVPQDTVDYLKSVLPPKEGVADAYDFNAYLQTVFEH